MRTNFNDTMFRLVIFSCLFLAIFAASRRRNKPAIGRIIGGNNTEISEVPYQVSVQYRKKHSCGGSIIGPRHILSAAHCFKHKNLRFFSIRAGSNYHNQGGQVLVVIGIISHPNYDEYSSDYDVAVLVLEDYLTAEEGVQIATLSNVEPQEGDMVLISGWGTLEEGKKDATELLQSVQVPVVSKTLCRENYEHEEAITDRMFCAGHPSGGKDACQGDSGGPAVVNGKLAGIVSWGEGCGDEKYPGVYASVANLLSWISAQVRH